MSENKTLEPFAIRAERLLDRLFLGRHHVPKIKKENVETPFERWEVNDSGDWSTFDFERLTRLVVLAHDECVRASICPSGPRMVKIVLFPRFGRERSLGISRCHPILEDAVAGVRK